MKIQNFFRHRMEGFVPRTPFAAIKAFEADLLPIEHFIFRSTSTISLDEQMIDLDEIERVLAKPDLDLQANLLLINILELLINDPDAEIALLAAESINMIEARYNVKIEKYKEQYKKDPTPETGINIARQYYELAVLNGSRESIRAFYYKEAFLYIKNIVNLETIQYEDLYMLMQVLVELKFYEYAISLIEHLLETDDNVLLYFLKAEVEFERQNYTEVFKIISDLKQRVSKMNISWGNIYSYWMDNPWIERSEFV